MNKIATLSEIENNWDIVDIAEANYLLDVEIVQNYLASEYEKSQNK